MTLDSRSSPSFFCAAVIGSAHGIRGHVKVKCFLENPDQFGVYSPFYNEKGEEICRVSKILSKEGNMLIVSLEGITDRNQAELLRGTELFVPHGKLPRLSGSSYYHADLIGLQVLSSGGGVLGKVHALFNFGAGDLLEIKKQSGSLEMLPFTEEFIPDVQLEKGFLVVSQEGEAFLEEEQKNA